LTESSSQVNVGQAVTFTAKVKQQSGSGIPTGQVSFLEGQTSLGSGTLDGSGTATLSTSSLSQGGHTIVASYAGNSGDGPSTSASVTVTVAPAATPSYTLSVSSSDVTVTPGEVANLTVTVTPENGFNTPIDLACSGMPAGMSCSFSPPTVTPDGKPVSSTLSILSNANTASAQRDNQGLPGHNLALGLVMPWGILSLLGLKRRGSRSRRSFWAGRVAVAATLILGSIWVSGCGYQVNGSVFTMTVTSSGRNVPTQTSQVIVNISK
jgi:hypothetical protein